MDEALRKQFADKYKYYTDNTVRRDPNAKKTLNDKLGNLEYRAASTVLSGAGNSLAGGVNALSTVGNMGSQTIKNVAGDNKVSNAMEKLVNKGYSSADKLQNTSQYDYTKASEGLGTVGNTLVNAGVAGTQMVGDALLGSINPVLSLASLGTRAFGNSAQEARQAGANLNQQLAYGASNAAVEVLSEKLFNGLSGLYGSGIADELGEKIVGKIAKSGKGRVALNILKNMGEEATEELIAGVIEPGLKSIYNNKKVFDNYDKDTKAEIIQSMIVGGLLGGFGGAVESIQNKKTDAFQNLYVQDQIAQEQAKAEAKAKYDAEIQAEKDAITQKLLQEQEIARQQKAQAEELQRQQKIQDERNQALFRAQEEFAENKNQVADDLAFFEEQKRLENSNAYGVRVVFNSQGNREYEIYRKKKVLSPEGKYYEKVATPLERAKYATFEEALDSANQLNKDYFNQLYSNSPIDITESQVKKAMGSEYYKKPTETSLFGIDEPTTLDMAQAETSAEPIVETIPQNPVQTFQTAPIVETTEEGQTPNNNFSTPNPKEKGENTFVRQGAETARDSKVTPDYIKELIDKEIDDGNFSAPRIPNSAIVNKAARTIMEKGWDDAYRDWQMAVASGRTTATDEAIGALLYKNAANAGNEKLALDILADYNLSGTNLARALQIRSIMSKLNPSSRLYLIQRSAAKVSKNLGMDTEIKINEALQTEYLNAKTEEAKNEVFDKMISDIAQQVPPTLMEKFKEFRYLNMLGNLRTQLRNVFGNASSLGVWSLNNITKSVVENTAEALGIKVEKTTAINPGAERIQAGKDLFDSNKDIQRIAMGSGKYDINEANAGLNDIVNEKLRDERKKAIFRRKDGSQGLFLNVAEKADSITGWAMEKGDIVFSKETFAKAFAGYLKANNITAEQWNSAEWQNSHKDIANRAIEYSVKQAQEVTFRDSNAFSDWVSKLARDPKTPKGVRLALEGLFPFRRTPANVFVRAEEYSPFGFINTAVKYAQMKQGDTNITGSDIVTQLSKSLTGTMIYALGAYLRKHGLLRGGDDEDKKQQAYDQQQGHQNYSLEIGGKSYTLDWLSTAAIPLFMGVAWQDATKDGFEFTDLLKVLDSATDPMIEMSMLSSVNDLIEQLKYGESGTTGQILGTLAFSYATQLFTNTLIGQMERTSEKNRMSTYIDPNSNLPSWMQRQLGKASAKTPLWDYNQYEYIDMWGNTESNGDVLASAAENFISPGYASNIKTSKLDEELTRLAGKVGTSVYPSSYDKKFDVKTYNENGNITSVEEKKLNKDEYVKYAKTVGQTRADTLNKLISSSEYKKLDDEKKAKVIANIYEYANYKGKTAVSNFKANPNSWLDKAETAVSNGVTINDYIIARTLMDADGNGSISQEEAQKYLDSSNLNNSQRAVVWGLTNSQWKTNPYSNTTKSSSSSNKTATSSKNTKDIDFWMKKLK